MKLVHGDSHHPKNPARPSAMALSAFLLSSCAALQMHPAPEAPQSRISAAEPCTAMCGAPDSFAPHAAERRSLLSQWVRGRCVFEGGRHLSYSDDLGSRQRSLRVDSDAHGAQSVLCSDDFTVLMLPDRAVVTLGGERILEGDEMLGMVGGRFIPANSYEVSLKPIISEDGGTASSALSEAKLQVVSRAGRRWSIDLADPYAGWNIY